MNLSSLKTKANSKLSDFWDALSVRQEAYHLKHDNYFQLIVGSPVKDGVDSTFELKHPSDQVFQTDVNFAFNSPIPFQIRVDVWGNKMAKGYKVTVVVELLDGRKFTRSRELTDPRVRKQDYDEQDQPVGDPYYVGETSIVTTKWTEVTEE